MKAWLRVLAVLMGTGMLLASLSLPAAASPRIERVHAAVAAAAHLPPMVQARMEQSVAAIASQLLLGMAADADAQELREKAVVIQEVFDKVLVGYSVAHVSIVPGEDAAVQVELIPWADVIESVAVAVTVEGMPPEVEALVRRDLAGVEQVFAAGLEGLPLAAADWTNGVLKQRVNAFMAEHLPEFRADFDVLPDAAATVKLTVYPRLPVVRTADLSMRSDTMPNMSLLAHRRFLEERVQHLVGVPVPFVARHEAEFAKGLAASLDALPDFVRLRMRTQVQIRAAERMEVMCRSDSDVYRIRMEGWADVGRSGSPDDDVVFRLHAGRKLSRLDELFLRLDLRPQDVKAHWAAGYAREIGAGSEAAIRYDMTAHRFEAAVQQRLSPLWSLRYEYRWAEHGGEAALRYKLHDFLGLEYVAGRHDKWLRLIGNF